ncbi:lecithin retinol acyltransferase family protein [Bacillus sp. ISL-37]|uniref:lecithin retinol acyltransferase family protein n=1 Tax=Bacillus sp. ISL-37 TaxID=2819123 RepID=UPI001BEADA90|nr:lecithin retinol acyltransferase family protein [Bacillus sp. ISL-37]MBT2684226.1 lecithin retinol acyltransferase family protein [Bacillus sp. ISL-37]
MWGLLDDFLKITSKDIRTSQPGTPSTRDIPDWMPKKEREQEKKEIKRDTKKLIKQAKQLSPLVGDVLEARYLLSETIDNHSRAFEDRRSIHDLENSTKKFYRGDHLYVNRWLGLDYSHHGLYLGRGNVIHYSQFEVRIDSLEDFAQGGKIHVMDSDLIYTIETVIRRAKSKLGEEEYDLLFNNCEHFVNWCRNGERRR